MNSLPEPELDIVSTELESMAESINQMARIHMDLTICGWNVAIHRLEGWSHQVSSHPVFPGMEGLPGTQDFPRYSQTVLGTHAKRVVNHGRFLGA